MQILIIFLTCFLSFNLAQSKNIENLIALLTQEKYQEQSRRELLLLGKDAVAPLIKFAIKENKPLIEAREIAVQLLGEIGDLRAVDPLLTLLQKHLNNSLAIFIIQSLGDLKSPKATSALLKLLKQKNLRKAAVLALSKINDPTAIDVLIEFLPQAPVKFRKPLTTALGKLKARKALAPLAEQLYMPNRGLYIATLKALENLGDKSVVKDILATLDSKDAEKYAQSISTLGSLQDPKAFTAIKTALKDKRYQIRLMAIEALGKSNTKKGLLTLTKISKKLNSSLASKAIRAIGQIQHPETTKTLLEIASTHPNSFLRWQAVQSFLKIRPYDLPLLISGLKNSKWQYKSLEILIRLGPSIAPTLMENYAKESQIQNAIIYVLGEIKNKDAVLFLLTLLKEKSTSEEKKIGIVRALGKISSPLAIPDLRTLLRKKLSLKFHHELLIALAKSKDSRIIPDLLRYIKENRKKSSPEIVQQLKGYDDDDLCKALLNLLEIADKSELTITTCHALSSQSYPQTKEVIARIMKKKKLPQKIYIAGLLARYKDRKAFNWLKRMLKHPNGIWRQLAASEFLKLESKDIYKHIIPLLDDSEKLIRIQVWEKLRHLSEGKDFGKNQRLWSAYLRKKFEE